MNVELRGTIRAAHGTKELQIDVPAGGVPLSQLLEVIAATHPRAGAYLTPSVGDAVLFPQDPRSTEPVRSSSTHVAL